MRTLALGLLFAATSAHADPVRAGDEVVALAGTRASLVFDGPWLPQPLKADTTLSVWSAAYARPQLHYLADGVTLSLHVDAAGLAPVLRDPAVVVPSAALLGGAIGDRTPGMRLDAGQRLASVGPDESGATAVTVKYTWREGGGYDVRGYVPTAAIAKSWRPARTPYQPRTPNASLPKSFELLDAPGGTVFVTARNDGNTSAAKLETKAGYTLVQLDRFGIVGWIGTKQLRRLRRPRESIFGGMIGSVGDPPATTLPEHTRVYDAIDGIVVGEVGRWFTLKPVEERDGWRRFELKTEFGPVSVWAR